MTSVGESNDFVHVVAYGNKFRGAIYILPTGQQETEKDCH